MDSTADFYSHNFFVLYLTLVSTVGIIFVCRGVDCVESRVNVGLNALTTTTIIIIIIIIIYLSHVLLAR